jgi:hypothetical protein
MIRRLSSFLVVFAMICAASAVIHAQTAVTPAADVRTNTMVPAYDLTKEIKIQGTIQKIDTTGSNGLAGTQILIQTATGVVDAHLGFGAASNPTALGISEGQSVTIVGMMQTVGSNTVLLARILTTPNHIFVLRNEHGIPVRLIPHSSGQKGPVFNSVLTKPATRGQGGAVNA